MHRERYVAILAGLMMELFRLHNLYGRPTSLIIHLLPLITQGLAMKRTWESGSKAGPSASSVFHLDDPSAKLPEYGAAPIEQVHDPAGGFPQESLSNQPSSAHQLAYEITPSQDISALRGEALAELREETTTEGLPREAKKAKKPPPRPEETIGIQFTFFPYYGLLGQWFNPITSMPYYTKACDFEGYQHKMPAIVFEKWMRYLDRLPNPILLTTTSIGTDSLRPFRFWLDDKRDKLINDETHNIDISSFLSVISQKSKKPLNRASDAPHACLLPINYRVYYQSKARDPSHRFGYITLRASRDDKAVTAGNLIPKLEVLLRLCLFYYSFVLKTTKTVDYKYEKFIRWFEQVWQPRQGFPLIGDCYPLERPLTKDDFGDAQKLVMYALISPAFGDIVDPVGLSLVAMMLQETQMALWDTTFASKERFWRSMFLWVLNSPAVVDAKFWLNPTEEG
ncbi:hypothetical protein O181_023410 [Austropuccinia psidii MF-1]|uniref:Uncharacterized protein n=1 Tax=Austropuccinia psidii MF-1 TaxID=1389203 RepID=A0A9Q3CIF4_9BASI|nr:hypothetical protein [Austropuccinia psidii MF-1]